MRSDAKPIFFIDEYFVVLRTFAALRVHPIYSVALAFSKTGLKISSFPTKFKGIISHLGIYRVTLGRREAGLR